MSHEALPIDAASFAQALEGLPIDAVHNKAAELRNSIAHLKHSNDQMLPFAEEGDQDCKDAMFENLVVIGRMNERIALLRAEVERRGMRWADAEDEDRQAGHESSLVNGTAALAGTGVAGEGGEAQAAEAAPRQSGRLTDAELMARLEERLGPRAGADVHEVEDESEGVHL